MNNFTVPTVMPEELMRAYELANEAYQQHRDSDTLHTYCVMALHREFGDRPKVEACYLRFIALNNLRLANTEELAGRVIPLPGTRSAWIDGNLFTVAAEFPLSRLDEGFDTQAFLRELTKYPMPDHTQGMGNLAFNL